MQQDHMIAVIQKINSSYSIYYPPKKNKKYKGNWSIAWGNLSTKIYDENDNLVLTVKRNFSLLKMKLKYDLTFHKLNIQTSIYPHRLFRGHWRCTFQKNTYDYYLHMGNNSSLFKGDIQVAKYSIKRLSFLGHEGMTIYYEKSENLLLLISFDIIFSMGEDNYGNVASFNFGNIIFKGKKENLNWRTNDL